MPASVSEDFHDSILCSRRNINFIFTTYFKPTGLGLLYAVVVLFLAQCLLLCVSQTGVSR